MTKKKLFLAINLVLICAVFIGNYFYLSEYSLLKKALCSSGFALIGLVNLAYALTQKDKQLRYSISMALGLFLAMLGDIILGFDFTIGAASFAAGHICFAVAYYFLCRPAARDFVISGALFLASAAFLLFFPGMTFEQPFMKYVCLAYALVISCMTGKAISNFSRERTLQTVILLIGSVLFFFSDLMLVCDWFLGMGRIAGILCMSTYYPAECILAYSVFHLSNAKNQ